MEKGFRKSAALCAALLICGLTACGPAQNGKNSSQNLGGSSLSADTPPATSGEDTASGTPGGEPSVESGGQNPAPNPGGNTPSGSTSGSGTSSGGQKEPETPPSVAADGRMIVEEISGFYLLEDGSVHVTDKSVKYPYADGYYYHRLSQEPVLTGCKGIYDRLSYAVLFADGRVYTAGSGAEGLTLIGEQVTDCTGDAFLTDSGVLYEITQDKAVPLFENVARIYPGMAENDHKYFRYFTDKSNRLMEYPLDSQLPAAQEIAGDVSQIQCGGGTAAILKNGGGLYIRPLGGEPERIASDVVSFGCYAANEGALTWYINASRDLYVYGQTKGGKVFDTPVLVASDVAEVAGGGSNLFYLTGSGALYAWGDNDGQAISASGASFCEQPVLVAQNVSKMAVDRRFLMYLTQDNKLYAFGPDSECRKRLPGEEPPLPYVPFLRAADVKDAGLFQGGLAVCCVKTNGERLIWGSNTVVSREGGGLAAACLDRMLPF